MHITRFKPHKVVISQAVRCSDVFAIFLVLTRPHIAYVMS